MKVMHRQVEGGVRSVASEGLVQLSPRQLLRLSAIPVLGLPASPELGTSSQLSLQRVSCSFGPVGARLILHSSPWPPSQGHAFLQPDAIPHGVISVWWPREQLVGGWQAEALSQAWLAL